MKGKPFLPDGGKIVKDGVVAALASPGKVFNKLLKTIDEKALARELLPEIADKIGGAGLGQLVDIATKETGSSVGNQARAGFDIAANIRKRNLANRAKYQQLARGRAQLNSIGGSTRQLHTSGSVPGNPGTYVDTTNGDVSL